MSTTLVNEYTNCGSISLTMEYFSVIKLQITDTYYTQHGWISKALCLLTKQKPDTKSYIIHDSIYMTFWKGTTDVEIRSMILRAEGQGRGFN